MKRLSFVLLILAPSSAFGGSCEHGIRQAYLAVQGLYEQALDPQRQLELQEILQSLYVPVKGNRYSTRGLSREFNREKHHYEKTEVNPVWVGIDWYGGGNRPDLKGDDRGANENDLDYGIPGIHRKNAPPK